MPEPENFSSWDLHVEQQREIRELMDKLEPHYEGYSRMVILLTSVRIMAAMLAPARRETQDETLKRLPSLLRSMIDHILSQVAAMKV